MPVGIVVPLIELLVTLPFGFDPRARAVRYSIPPLAGHRRAERIQYQDALRLGWVDLDLLIWHQRLHRLLTEADDVEGYHACCGKNQAKRQDGHYYRTVGTSRLSGE